MKTNNQIELQIELHYSTFILQGLNFSIKKKKKQIFLLLFFFLTLDIWHLKLCTDLLKTV